VLVVGNAYTIHYIADSDPEVEKEIASLAAGGYYRLITS
jgi:hypothetical protein